MTLSQLCNPPTFRPQVTTACFCLRGCNVIKDRQYFKHAQLLIFIDLTLDLSLLVLHDHLKKIAAKVKTAITFSASILVSHRVPTHTSSNPLHWQSRSQLPNTAFCPGAFQHTQNWSMSSFIQLPALDMKPCDTVIDACRVAFLQICLKHEVVKATRKKKKPFWWPTT